MPAPEPAPSKPTKRDSTVVWLSAVFAILLLIVTIIDWNVIRLLRRGNDGDITIAMFLLVASFLPGLPALVLGGGLAWTANHAWIDPIRARALTRRLEAADRTITWDQVRQALEHADGSIVVQSRLSGWPECTLWWIAGRLSQRGLPSPPADKFEWTQENPPDPVYERWLAAHVGEAHSESKLLAIACDSPELRVQLAKLDQLREIAPRLEVAHSRLWIVAMHDSRKRGKT